MIMIDLELSGCHNQQILTIILLTYLSEFYPQMNTSPDVRLIATMNVKHLR